MKQTPCENLEATLLEGGALGAADQMHLEHCESCAELHGAMKDTAPALTALGAAARKAKVTDAAALERVRAAALSRLRQTGDRAGAQPTAKVVEVNLRNRTTAIRAALRGWFAQPGMAMGGLAVVCLMMAAGWGVNWHRAQPVGSVDFTSGLVEVDHDGRPMSWRGLPAEARLMRGSTVTVREQSAILSLAEGGVRLAMAPRTEMTVTGPRAVELRQGEIWLDVDPRGKGFEVRTPNGTARVAGTVFGVSAEASRMRVDVARGEVIVSQSDESRNVTRGQWVAAALDGGVGLVTERAEGEALPVWVVAVKQAEDMARASMFVPSIEAGN